MQARRRDCRRLGNRVLFLLLAELSLRLRLCCDCGNPEMYNPVTRGQDFRCDLGLSFGHLIEACDSADVHTSRSELPDGVLPGSTHAVRASELFARDEINAAWPFVNGRQDPAVEKLH